MPASDTLRCWLRVIERASSIKSVPKSASSDEDNSFRRVEDLKLDQGGCIEYQPWRNTSITHEYRSCCIAVYSVVRSSRVDVVLKAACYLFMLFHWKKTNYSYIIQIQIA